MRTLLQQSRRGPLPPANTTHAHQTEQVEKVGRLLPPGEEDLVEQVGIGVLNQVPPPTLAIALAQVMMPLDIGEDFCPVKGVIEIFTTFMANQGQVGVMLYHGQVDKGLLLHLYEASSSSFTL